MEELKAEVARLSTFIPDAEESKESVQLTEKQNEQKNEKVEEILTGKNILILGGYRSKGHIEANGYQVYTHEARNLDPHYYEYLNKADLIIILTRYISHHAMWEAKEYAILEQKSIFYSTFTNIPTILKEAASEYAKCKTWKTSYIFYWRNFVAIRWPRITNPLKKELLKWLTKKIF